jgi:hypothetical protein
MGLLVGLCRRRSTPVVAYATTTVSVTSDARVRGDAEWLGAPYPVVLRAAPEIAIERELEVEEAACAPA